MWVTEQYLINAFGSETVTALGLTGDVFTQFEASARSTVAAYMQFAGYDIPESLDNASISAPFLQRIVSGLVLRDALQLRKGIALTDIQKDSISEALWLLDAVQSKKIPIPGMQPNAIPSIGGSQSSNSEYSSVYRSSGGSFSPNKLRGF